MANTRLMGMSYEQASKEGTRLIEQAAKTGSWHSIVDDLVELRGLMKRLGETPREVERSNFNVKIIHGEPGGSAALPEFSLSDEQEYALQICLPVLTASKDFDRAEIDIDAATVKLFQPGRGVA